MVETLVYPVAHFGADLIRCTHRSRERVDQILAQTVKGSWQHYTTDSQTLMYCGKLELRGIGHICNDSPVYCRL